MTSTVFLHIQVGTTVSATLTGISQQQASAPLLSSAPLSSPAPSSRIHILGCPNQRHSRPVFKAVRTWHKEGPCVLLALLKNRIQHLPYDRNQQGNFPLIPFLHFMVSSRGEMHIQIVPRQNCEANNQPISTYVQSLLFYQKWESWPLEKKKKVTILHLAVFIYCISVFFCLYCKKFT